ncbi:transmembrane protein 44 isoform X2 [Trichomycterus rosablanca]|uniref:transmembrane protein 44 isoform X2 n=1 Tax=Trichomycterus rosablanca TaxID=2290929 RepID=UPI002F35583A
MDKLFDRFLHWWDEVTGCFYFQESKCISTAVGFSSMLFLLLSYLVLFCGSWKFKDTLSITVCVLYSLIGNVCNVAGAFLSNQSFLQLIMAAFMTTLDFVHLLSITVVMCWWSNSKTGKKARMISKRRRQNLPAVCLLFGVGGCVYLNGRMNHTHPITQGFSTNRKLLNVIVHDNIELIGYVLGLLYFVISWTSRFPFFLKANRGEMSDPAHVSSRVLSALAGALYASAILLYDPLVESIVKALPWILSGASAALLDIAIVLLSCCRIRYKHQSVRPLGLDTESLLTRSNSITSNQHHSSRDKTVRRHLSSRKSSSPKMTEMGRYIDVNVQPVRKVCLKEVTITREGLAEDQPLKRCVKVVRVDECYSSGSATDSSCLSSELECGMAKTSSMERCPVWSFPALHIVFPNGTGPATT